jgi:glycosyltransferase involved in cell wall biosynthesis
LSEARPKILHLIPHDGVGGVEVAARTMLSRNDLACDFRLLLIAGRTLAPERAQVVESPYGSALNPLAQLRAVRACLRERPDVLLVSLWRSVLVGISVRLLRPKTRLVFFLNLEAPAHFVDGIAAKIALLFADEVWADSAATLAARLGTRRIPSRVVSFVTGRLEQAGGDAAPRPAFVSWCRLARQKGIDRSLRLIAELVRSGVDARYDIWGPDDGERPALEALAAELGISGNVAFRGSAAREDLPGIAAGACFFLQLSRSEGMAMGTVEAMQLGLVPIVTAVGEMGRYVSDGKTGLLADAAAPAETAGRIAALLQDPSEYARLRRQATDYWLTAPLYADDICRASHELVSRRALSPAS